MEHEELIEEVEKLLERECVDGKTSERYIQAMRHIRHTESIEKCEWCERRK